MKKLATLIAALGLLGTLGCTATVTSEDELGKDDQAWGRFRPAPPPPADDSSSSNDSSSGSTGEVTCNVGDGRMQTLAALAVAMADELGRWDALADLYQAGWYVDLKWDAPCSNGCEKTRALLALQTDHAYDSLVGGVWIFNIDGFRTAIMSSFDRQVQKNINSPFPAHRLTKVAGPTLSHACGSGYPTYDYTYKVTKPDGGSLSWSEAEQLHNALCFFHEGACGGNEFIRFKVGDTLPGCRSGDICVSIDPTDGDSGTTATTTASGIPSFRLNRLYNPRDISDHGKGLYRSGEKCAMLGTYEVTTLKRRGVFNKCEY
jgi:hypothetical protein